MTASPVQASDRLLTIPNVLTGARIVAVPFFLFAAARGYFTTAFVLFVSAAVTDIIDGFVARQLNQRSRFGAFLDPIADKMIMVCGYIFFTFSANVAMPIPRWLTLFVFLRDLLIPVFAYMLYKKVGVTRFPPSWAGKASTLAQASALAAAIGVSAFGDVLRLTATILFPLALAMTLFSAAVYLRRAYVLLKAA
jgi:cardiolipin synthase